MAQDNEELELEEDFSTPLDEEDNQANMQLQAVDMFDKFLKTHDKLKHALVGKITAIEENYAKVSLITSEDMVLDEMGLIHSGFVYSAADYTACIAINKPNTITIGSKVSFLAPAKLGNIIEFEARVKFEDLKKREVKVVGKINDIRIFQATFYMIVLEKHIFETKIKNLKVPKEN